MSTRAGCGGWFHKAFKRGQKKGETAFESWQSPSWANPHLERAIIEEQRGYLPADDFRASYGAEFVGIDPFPCDTCGGPSPNVPCVIVLWAGQKLGKCPECGAAVGGDGKTVVHQRKNGKRSMMIVQLDVSAPEGCEVAGVFRPYGHEQASEAGSSGAATRDPQKTPAPDLDPPA